MAQYKFNRFHWHGDLWDGVSRLKNIRNFTQIGGYRTRDQVVKGDETLELHIGDNTPYGGFTRRNKSKISRRLRQSATHHHDSRKSSLPVYALAAYPELGCKENYNYKVQNDFGEFLHGLPPTEKTFQFCGRRRPKQRFVSRFAVHPHRDEALKGSLERISFRRNLKRKRISKDEHEVQSYFILGPDGTLHQSVKARKFAFGWDEILEGGLSAKRDGDELARRKSIEAAKSSTT